MSGDPPASGLQPPASQRMGPDLRLPIGIMFILVAAVLVTYGLLEPRVRAPLTRLNINLFWGLALLVFGVVMLLLGWRAQRRKTDSS